LPISRPQDWQESHAKINAWIEKPLGGAPSGESVIMFLAAELMYIHGRATAGRCCGTGKLFFFWRDKGTGTVIFIHRRPFYLDKEEGACMLKKHYHTNSQVRAIQSCCTKSLTASFGQTSQRCNFETLRTNYRTIDIIGDAVISGGHNQP
jgi:hypothetical protein